MLLFHLLILAGLILALGAVILNVSCFHSLGPAAPPADPPLVSVLVPARNEELNIGTCIGSLLAQDWPRFEVIVLDDRSEDGTGEILRSFNDPRLRVIGGSELPEGWVGKNWACHQLSEAARGEWMLFLDADTRHEPGFLSALLAYAQTTRADLLSAWPRLVMHTLGEKLIISMIVLLGMILYPHALIQLLQRKPHLARFIPRKRLRMLGAANGQSLLFRRESYARIGGHAALHDHLVEDVAFGRTVAARIGEGMRLINCDAIRFSSCRMYRSFSEAWLGFVKNGRAAFEDNIAGFWLVGAFVVIGLLYPFIAIFLPHAPHGIVLAEIAIIYFMRFLLCARFRISWLAALLHPLTIILSQGIGFHSLVRTGRKGVEWKGRRYTIAPRARS
jgi:chlorobactene glucosyltransferase